jgi:hypothetical protein
MDKPSGKSWQFKALYDMQQEIFVITHHDMQYIFSKGIIEPNQMDLLTHSQ